MNFAPRNWTDEELSDLAADWVAGVSAVEMAKRCASTETTVRDLMRDRFPELRDTRDEALAARRMAEVSPAKALAQAMRPHRVSDAVAVRLMTSSLFEDMPAAVLAREKTDDHLWHAQVSLQINRARLERV